MVIPYFGQSPCDQIERLGPVRLDKTPVLPDQRMFKPIVVVDKLKAVPSLDTEIPAGYRVLSEVDPKSRTFFF